MSATTSSLASRASIPPSTNLYHYTPTKGLCYLFVVLFAVTTLAHVFFAVRSRLWWLFPTVVLAGAGELIGWIARTSSSSDPTQRNDYIIQSTCLVLAPTPLLAAIFIIFGRLAQAIGSGYGRLTPRLYSRIFLTCDIVALLIQGSGGGIAASANNTSSQKLGSDIMLVGIIFQTVAMVVFIALAAEFFWRYAKDTPARPDAGYYSPGAARRAPLSRNLKLMTLGLCLAMLFLLVRAFYRVCELADGWNGRIISTQWLFNLFDGAMIVLTMYTLNAFHPGRLLPRTLPDPQRQDSVLEVDKPLAYGQVETVAMRAV
ncbi:RTA1 domain-containing protein [Phanerochaete sordida]|uniref:RTA1 domain-containing protein n=1 Tax=Phanerochaete sordida TaxID=48140 RepID=A0A9P3GGD4_9APHY|nr:RTA1 domain-containing protein [Phanerochaete sordida]